MVGIKGKHNFKERTIILGTSYLIMSASVLSLKSITKVERPDGRLSIPFRQVIPQQHLQAQNFCGKNTKMFQFGMV